MVKYLKSFFRSEFNRNILTLMPGTIISQAIPIVFSIVLARIYAPDVFGIYFVFVSFLSIGIIIATGKFELAILIPKTDAEASTLIGVALTTSILFCIVLLCFVFCFNGWLFNLLQTPRFNIWLFFIPVSLFFSSANQVFYYWHNRQGRYRLLAVSKIIQSLSSAVLQLVLGYIFFGETGLIIGLIAGQVISFLYLLFKYYHFDTGSRFSLFKNYRQMAMKYIYFPKDVATASLVNEISNQIPNLFMTRYLGQAVVGHYGYAQRTIRTPIGVISNAFSDVFKSRAAKEYNEQGNIRSIFGKTLITLSSISVLPFLILFITAPALFGWVFGPAYEEAGVYARIFSVPIFLSFIVSPLSSGFYIINRTSIFLAIKIAGLVLVIASVLITYLFSAKAVVLMVALAVGNSITNIIILGALLRFVYINRNT